MILEAFLTGAAVMATTGTPSPTDPFWYTDTVMSFPMSRDRPSADGSLQTVAVLACVRVLSETLGSLPLHIYRAGEPAWPGSTRMATRKALDHPLYRVMRQPNQWQTGMEFREMMQGHLALRGNAYAAIIPGRFGAVTELIPKHPDRMQVFRRENGRLGYLYRPTNGEPEPYTQDEIFHVRGYSIDGMVGISPIAAARNAIALAQQAEDHGVSFYQNMAKPGGVLKMPAGESLEDEAAYARLKTSWRAAHSGKDLYSVAILENGMEWQQVGISNEDSQWLESRRFQVVEIARLFRVSPHMIYSAIEHGNTYANIEQTDLSFAKHTMLPWLIRWEQAIVRDLISEDDVYYPKFAIEGLLRADTQARKEFYKTMFELTVFNANDILEFEDLNPREDGETYYRASNLIPVDAPGVSVIPAPAASLAAESHLVMADTLALPMVKIAPPAELSEGLPDIKAPGVLRGWAADVAARIANAELRELAKRADRADDDRDKFNAWVNGYWGGRHGDYIEAAVAPLLASSTSEVTPEAVAATVAEQAINTLSTGDPLAVLEAWKDKRAGQLTELLMEAIRDENEDA